MKLRSFIFVLIIAALVFECCSQRGGGRSRSSSSRSWGRSRSGGSSLFFGSSRSRSYRSGNGTSLWDWLFGSDSNETNIPDASNSTDSTFQYHQGPNDGWQTTKSTGTGSISWGGLIIAGIAAVLGYLGFKGKGLSGEGRAKEIRKITDEFEQVNECRSSLSDNERNKHIDKFMQSQWKVQLKTNSSGNYFTWELKMKNLTKRTDFVYEIQAEGFNDDNGNSTIRGIILFRDDGMSICFDKLHNDRERAGQTGKWDLLIYEGHLKDGIFYGLWYYQGFKNDAQYSGTMKMIPK